MGYIIFVDIDGTLKNSKGIITKKTKTSIKKIVKKGHYVVICTGRPRTYAVKISKECGASPYVISSNGSEIYDYHLKKVLYVNKIDDDSCVKLYELAQKNNVRIVMGIEDFEVVNHTIKTPQQRLLELEIDKFVMDADVKQCFLIDNDRLKMQRLKEKIEDIKNIWIVNQADCLNNPSLSCNCNVWYSIVHINTSKGNSIKELCQYLKIPLENTIGIGNDYNDIPMFETVNYSVAMENASKSVKDLANQIINSADEDGVSLYLEELYKQIKDTK